MLDPHHICSWTEHKRCELRVDADSVHMAGISMRVVLSGLFDPALRWYSMTNEDGDTTWILACTDSIEVAPAFIDGPVATAIGDLFAVQEHQLTDTLIEQLQLNEVIYGNKSITTVITTSKEQTRVRYLIMVHDDCFSYVYPADDSTQRLLLAAIAQLYGFYLNREIDASTMTDELILMLSSGEATRLSAYQEHGASGIAISKDMKQWASKIWPGWGFKIVARLELSAAQAVWRRVR